MAGRHDLPRRVIAGLAAKLSRAAHGIRYDELHDEIVITNPFAQAILTFRGSAHGDEAPIRVIQGSNTQFSGSDKLDVDPVHDEIFIAEEDQILVYPRTANGNVAPIRVIRGPATRLASGGGAIAVDPVRNLIVVFDSRGDASGGLINRRNDPRLADRQRFGALLTFRRTDNGDVTPQSVIEGPRAGLVRVNQIQVYPAKGWVFVSLRPLDDNYFAGVWSIDDTGDVPPRWVLGALPPGYRPGRTIAFDAGHQEVFGTAYGAGEAAVLLRYSFPELFR